MREIPRKNDWLLAQARELYRKIKKGRIVFTKDEEVIYEAGRLAAEEEMRKKAKVER